MPYGVFWGIMTYTIPYMLRVGGMPVQSVSAVSALASSAVALFFLWAPLVDIGLKRKYWIVFAATAVSVLVGVAISNSLTSFKIIFGLLAPASVLITLLDSANGALMATTLPSDMQGRAAGWSQAGILTGIALGGGVSLWLLQRSSKIAPIIVATIVLPSLVALTIPENDTESLSVVHIYRDVLRETWQCLHSRRYVIGMLFFLSPVCSVAIEDVLSALGRDYGASGPVILRIAGFGAGLTFAGSLLGGSLSDQLSKPVAFIAGGFATAVCSSAIALSPVAPQTYVIGSCAYLVLTGFCNAAFIATVLFIIGRPARSAGSSFSLLVCCGNFSSLYMQVLDGLAHKTFGVRGVFAADGLLNGIAAILLFLVWRRNSSLHKS